MWPAWAAWAAPAVGSSAPVRAKFPHRRALAGRIQGGAGAVRSGPAALQPRGSPTKPASLGTRSGNEYVHIAVDDYSRLAYAEVLPDQKAVTAVGFLRRAVRFYRSLRIAVPCLLSPTTAGAYVGTIHALACRHLGIKHLRTRPYRPQTNGKAERFIRTLLSGWPTGTIARFTNAPQP